jgi:uncharacterized RDD family membrane protein YckC
MVGVMNAIAQVSPAPVSGPKLDNRRVMAAIVDLLIVTAGAVVILLAGDSLSGDRQSALGVVILGWGLYYFFALESGEGQTLGKRLMKLRVVRADGRPAGMREIAMRTILRVVDNYVVGLIVMLATGERRQRIGDLAAGTIVVDASALPVAPPAPVADEVVEDEPVEDEPVEDEPVEEEPMAEADPVSTQTITLPSRPAPPATVADLGEPEVEEEPVVEVEPEPVVEDGLPPVTSPSLEELAHDVEAAHSEPEAEPPDELPEDDGPVNVKSVETVSAMDLIMGAAEEDTAGEENSESDQDAEDPASQ